MNGTQWHSNFEWYLIEKLKFYHDGLPVRNEFFERLQIVPGYYKLWRPPCVTQEQLYLQRRINACDMISQNEYLGKEFSVLRNEALNKVPVTPLYLGLRNMDRAIE